MFDLASAISSATAMLGIAKGAVAARDDFKAQQAIGDAQGKLLEITTAALALSQTNISLADEIRVLKDQAHDLQLKAREREGYALAQIGPGVHAYQSQPAKEGATPPTHYLCQPCYDKGVKVVLRFNESGGDGLSSKRTAWICAENREHSFSVPS